MANKQTHEGHRERFRERIRNNGLQCLQPHEILEYLLFSFIPRKNTNDIAHELIDKFGSLSGVINADESQLMEVSGMTHNAALFLSSLREVFEIYLAEVNLMRQSIKDSKPIRTVDDAKNYLGGKMYAMREEQVEVVALDVHDKVIGNKILAYGSSSEVNVETKKVLQYAMQTGARGILIAHNHPGGNVGPSVSDDLWTLDALTVLKTINVELVDHLIFSGKNCYSYKAADKLRKMNDGLESVKEGIYDYD